MVIRTRFINDNKKSFYKKYEFVTFDLFYNCICRFINEGLIKELDTFKNFNFEGKFKIALKDFFENNEKSSFRKLRNYVLENYYGHLECSQIKKEFWLERGWDEEYSIKKVSELQSKNGKKFAEKLKENPEIRKTNTQLKWWTDKGYSKEEALKLLKGRQSFTLEKCIEKYGEKKGKNFYKNRQAAWRKTMDDKYDKHTQSQWRAKGAFVSKESLKLFTPFYEKLKDKFSCYLGIGKQKEFFIWSEKDKCIYSYDFTIKELGLIFEYQGEHVHPNPSWTKEKWDNWRQAFTKETADEVQEKYNKKIQLANEAGFKVVQLWSSSSFEENSKIISETLQSLQVLQQ